MLSVGVANTVATCLDYEFLHFNPPSGQTCGQYLQKYIDAVGGSIQNPDATSQCSYCQVSDTNVFLHAVASSYSDRWRNFGIMWAYVVFNIAAALLLYWLVRVPKKSKMTKEVGAPLTGLDVYEKNENDQRFTTPDETPIGGTRERNSPESKSLYRDYTAENSNIDPEKHQEVIGENGVGTKSVPPKDTESKI